MRSYKNVLGILISSVCFMLIATGCSKGKSAEAAKRLKDRYDDTFTYKGCYGDFPRADQVYEFESADFPGYAVKVAFDDDPYRLFSYDVSDNYQAIYFEQDMLALVEDAVKKAFPTEKYKLAESEYDCTDLPVCADLDEYMEHWAAEMSLIVYYDCNAAGALSPEELEDMLENEIPDGGGHIWLRVYLETNEQYPELLSHDEMCDYIMHEEYDTQIIVNR